MKSRRYITSQGGSNADARTNSAPISARPVLAGTLRPWRSRIISILKMKIIDISSQLGFNLDVVVSLNSLLLVKAPVTTQAGGA